MLLGRRWRWGRSESIIGGVGVIFWGINALLATLHSSEPNTCGHGLRWLKDATYGGAMAGVV